MIAKGKSSRHMAFGTNWRLNMKKIALAAAFAGAASTAFAGNLSEPVMEMPPMVVVEDTQAGTSGGLIIPLILAALVIAAIANNQ